MRFIIDNVLIQTPMHDLAKRDAILYNIMEFFQQKCDVLDEICLNLKSDWLI